MSSNYDIRGQLSPEDRETVASELGMDKIPVPRYEDLPEIHDAAEATERWNFLKALACVDAIASAALMGYIDKLMLPVDQGMNPRDWKRGWSQSVKLDTSKPIPVNDKITAATGITRRPCEANWYAWLAQNIKWVFTESGARAISPVILARTNGVRRNGRRVGKYLIAIYKLDRTPAWGRTEADMVANVGIMHPSNVDAKNKRLPIAGRVALPDIDAPASEDPTPGIG